MQDNFFLKRQDLEILEHSACRTEFGNAAVCGVIINNTNHEYDYAQVEVNFYDADNTLIDSAFDNINDFEPHTKWKFQVVPMSADRYSRYKIKGVTNW